MELLYALLGAFSGLPAWTRWVFVVLMLASILGISLVVTPMVALIVLGGLIVVALLVGGFLLLVRRARQKKAAAFGGDLYGQAGATPGQISDPARRARLDELRQAFEKGIAKFKAAGKELYEVPWYVIVGEPGAGKTEAIRHSNVGFPPGMQDEFQGVGGTINMNWWFTNHAVILDTAGRLLFEEVEPGTTGEWRVFLEMLKKHRNNCPINGLLLAIPAESLIKDPPAEIGRKAAKIATQLEQIQRQLDVRFPAYVVITKCDLLNGFREFFDDLVDPQAQHQMMGWSNPDPLDAPFRPALVDDHIHSVVERLRRRRQGLMVDPVARSLDRRADEVDRLYALPHSVSLIAPNLRHYLDTIFIAGTWSARPLFLRGIYFTSSLREGSALDQELAEALSVSVDALPEGRAWERERSYFLRDLFLEKAFRERGLVTRATDTKKLVLRRRLTLLGSGVAALLVLLAASWYGFNALKSSVGTQGGYWARAADGWSDHIWQPIVQRDIGFRYKYEGREPVGPGISDRSRLLFRAAATPLEAFHVKLHELSVMPIRVSWVFRPLTSFGVAIDRDRKAAQRVVFDGSVIKPLADAARNKMSQPSPDRRGGAEEARREGNALLSLIQLEAAIVKRHESKPAGLFTGEKFLPPLFRYVSADSFGQDLVPTLDLTYAETRMWPPDWLSGGSRLATNTAIDQGLSRFVTESQKTGESRSDVFPLIVKARDAVREFGHAENSLYEAARRRGPTAEIDRSVLAGYTRLQGAKQSLDLTLGQMKNAGFFEDGPVSLAAAYERLFGELRARIDIARAIMSETGDVLSNQSAVRKAITSVAGENPEHLLFREIQEKLKGLVQQLEAKFQPSFSDAELAELRSLDQLYLADPKTGSLHYEMRWSLYDKAVTASPPITYARTLDLIGQDWKPLADVFAGIARIREQVQNYHGLLDEKAITICKYCLARAERVHSDEFCQAYLDQAKTSLRAAVRFPLIWTWLSEQDALKPGNLVPAVNLIDKIKNDLGSPAFEGIKSPFKQPLADLRKRLDTLDPIRQALLTPEKHLRLCTVVLLNRNDQFRLSGQQIAMDTYKAIELRVGTIDHATPVKKGVIGRLPSDSPSDVEIGKFTLYEPFHFHFYFTMGDSRIAADIPAPANWTALRLLSERNARRLDGGRRWQFTINPAPGKLLWFELRFDAPLPELDDWPTAESIGIKP